MGRIDLTGTYRPARAPCCRCSAPPVPGDSWVDFPVTVTVSGGQFSTYVQTGRTGPNRFRVIDTDTDLASNEVTITIPTVTDPVAGSRSSGDPTFGVV